MSNALQFRPEDRLQKTWIPEGTKEYKIFKLITLENEWLAQILKNRFPLKPGELLLDVGGREGDIARVLQSPEYIHLVDPDPTLKLPFTPGKFWNERIQDIELSDKYKLIICSHVLGYFGTQNVQDLMFGKLVKLLASGGTLVLFYNSNTGYVGELLKFSKRVIPDGHYDYFDEALLKELNADEFDITHEDVSFTLDYGNFTDLSHVGWFLFGAKDQDIEGVAATFLPKLQTDLQRPAFEIEERATFVTRNSSSNIIH